MAPVRSVIFAVLYSTLLIAVRHAQGLTCRKCTSDGCEKDPGLDTCTVTGQFAHCIVEYTGYNLSTRKAETAEFDCRDSVFDYRLCDSEQQQLAYKASHFTKFHICCEKNDLCNEEGPVMLPVVNVTTGQPTEASSGGGSPPAWELTVIIVIPLICALLLALTVIIYSRWSKRPRHHFPEKQEEINTLMPYELKGNESLSELLAESSMSGSGSGLPFLLQTTIARQISLEENIGKGRYGEVWRGQWRGQDVAVKIFAATDDNSWIHEVEIYQTTWLRHENILGFIASDNKDMGLFTQLWMVTDFCPNGSIYDYISHPDTHLSLADGLKLMMTASRGLAHLHMEVFGAARSKPAMAHRDIKSKNFLVKHDGTACIADLGLAIRENDSNIPCSKGVHSQSLIPEEDSGIESLDFKSARESASSKPFNYRVGTRRYIAPEILDDSIRLDVFDSFRRTDTYSFSLVLWEIGRRCRTNGKCEDYEMPYQYDVQHDPDLADVRQVVIDQGTRPVIPSRWKSHKVLSKLELILEESWSRDSLARPTSVRVKTNLEELFSECDRTPEVHKFGKNTHNLTESDTPMKITKDI